jgi:UDP-N-acetylglucosamine 2-epimerase (non-hydrolysing)/UDP-GlcNAc:undecaprenyl-phosphate GlcNAc-1-phosphate transferase
MTIFGTRPEAIKMAPVIMELKKRADVEVINVSTSQHREMLDQVLELFGIVPDFDLRIMSRDQTLMQIVEKTIRGLSEILQKTQPDILLVQGDTTTAFTGALAGFYSGIDVGHVEAGLRTWDNDSPFPEEVNRKMISVVARHHFAPTQGNKHNLLKENIDPSKIVITGNTVIDSLKYIIENQTKQEYAAKFCRNGSKLILVTAHRRENFGQPIINICKALLEIARSHEDVEIVYPVHMNMNVQQPVNNLLAGQDRIHLIPPVNYEEIVSLMNKAYLVMTDSGGIQEEAPSLGKPVIVMRTETERPEAVEAGTVVVVGNSEFSITQKAHELLDNRQTYQKMVKAVNPYGDGKAAVRIVEYLLQTQH